MTKALFYSSFEAVHLKLISTELSKFNIIKENDFPSAWYRAVSFVLAHGVAMVFGSSNEKKRAWNSIQIIILYGNAISQILRGEIHPQFPFGDKKGEFYRREFDRNWFLSEYLKFPEAKKFTYLYIERLIRYIIPSRSFKDLILKVIFKKDSFIDQLAVLREQLKEQVKSGITSNRSQVITWQPGRDLFSASPPCFQSMQIIYLGNNEVKFTSNGGPEISLRPG